MTERHISWYEGWKQRSLAIVMLAGSAALVGSGCGRDASAAPARYFISVACGEDAPQLEVLSVETVDDPYGKDVGDTSVDLTCVPVGDVSQHHAPASMKRGQRKRAFWVGFPLNAAYPPSGQTSTYASGGTAYIRGTMPRTSKADLVIRAPRAGS